MAVLHILPLIAMTALILLGTVGTVGKLLFDDWQLRKILRLPAEMSAAASTEPASPPAQEP